MRTRDLRRSEKAIFTKKRQAGTTLVEILVVIVIFLIGILAVVQIFPGGFKLLLVSRNNSAATALGRDEIERLKDSPELLPEEVLAVRYEGGVPKVDTVLSPLGVDPVGSNPQINAQGFLTDDDDSTARKDWLLYSGANVARRIIGEGHRVPAPRMVDSVYGGLLLVEHGPIDRNAGLIAYANDLNRTVGSPLNPTSSGTVNIQIGTAGGGNATISVPTFASPAATAPFEYFVESASTSGAALYIPTATFARTYRLRFSGYVSNGSGYDRIDFTAIPLAVPAFTSAAVAATPFVRVDFTTIVTTYRGAAGPVGSVDLGTIRLAPQYVAPSGSTFTAGNPFEMVVLNPDLGVLLFNPAARQGVVTRPGGVSEPLIAKIDYDVLDWRVLREDFRVLNGNLSFQLALQSLKVGSQQGPDGRDNGGIPMLENSVGPTDNVVVVDQTTGDPIDETVANEAGFLALAVNKSRGLVTLVPRSDGTIPLVGPKGDVYVDPSNRTFRVLYRARQEWAIQLVKSASQYAILKNGETPMQGQCSLGRVFGYPNRVYFPKSDAGRKVTVDTLVYEDADKSVHTLEGQDFVIGYPTVAGSTDLPCIDLNSVDPAASGLLDDETAMASSVRSLGEPLRGVKGASVAVRVLWNPDQFRLTTDLTGNVSLANQWTRGFRKSTTETYLRAEETR